MSVDLEKIDLLRQRMHVSYREAKEALEIYNGDLVEALIYLEEKPDNIKHSVKGQGQAMMGQVTDLVKKGNRTKIKIKKGETTVFQFPASLGALGIAGAIASTPIALVGVLGTATLMAKKYSLELDAKNDRNGHQQSHEDAQWGEEKQHEVAVCQSIVDDEL